MAEQQTRQFMREDKQQNKVKLSPTPIILLLGVVVVVVLILLRPQASPSVSARSAYIAEVNPEARIIINGEDQTQAIQDLPSYSLSWLEPRDIEWHFVDHVTQANGQFVLVFQDGSERRLTPDMVRWLPGDVQKRLVYERRD